MACGEFSLIARYFDRVKSSRLDVETGIGDDCALLNIPEKQTLAISTDTLVAGIHFLPDIDPADLAYKALAVNLSDLAAMGADPAWLTLALTLPDVDEAWLAAFSDSLFEQLDYYDMQLIGGDTTRGPLSMTLGIHGLVPVGRALKRSGAKRATGFMLLARWAIALPGWRFYGVIFAWEAGGMPTIWSNAICARRRVFYKGRRYAISPVQRSIFPTV